MTHQSIRHPALSRRGLLAGSAGLIGTAAFAPGIARAQQNASLGAPASVISNPPRQWGRHHPSIYPDPDVIVVDPSFLPLRRPLGPQRPGPQTVNRTLILPSGCGTMSFGELSGLPSYESAMTVIEPSCSQRTTRG